MMQEHFSQWASRIRYWHVHDVDKIPADTALPEIEQLVGGLVSELKGTNTLPLSIRVEGQRAVL